MQHLHKEQALHNNTHTKIKNILVLTINSHTLIK